MTLRKTVATRLRALRERRGFTQLGLAAVTGLDPSAVAHFERGRRMPSPPNLILLADALSTSTDFILGRVSK